MVVKILVYNILVSNSIEAEELFDLFAGCDISIGLLSHSVVRLDALRGWFSEHIKLTSFRSSVILFDRVERVHHVDVIFKWVCICSCATQASFDFRICYQVQCNRRSCELLLSVLLLVLDPDLIAHIPDSVLDLVDCELAERLFSPVERVVHLLLLGVVAGPYGPHVEFVRVHQRIKV